MHQLTSKYKFYLYLKKNKPDLIICHNSVQATLPLFIAKILQINKRIYFNHGITFLGYKGLLKSFLYFLEYLNAKFSSQTITVSLEMKKHLDKIKRNTVIINNGSACGINISNEHLKKKKKKNKKIIITFIGRLEVRKGINTLLKILNFFEHNPNVKFIFCGFSNLEFENFAQKNTSR